MFEPFGTKLLGRHALGGCFWKFEFGFWIPKNEEEKIKNTLPTGG